MVFVFALVLFLFSSFLPKNLNVFADISLQKFILQQLGYESLSQGLSEKITQKGPRVQVETTGDYCILGDKIQGTITYKVQASDPTGVTSISIDGGYTRERRDGREKFFLSFFPSQQIRVSNAVGQYTIHNHTITDAYCTIEELKICTVASDDNQEITENFSSTTQGYTLFHPQQHNLNVGGLTLTTPIGECSSLSNVPTKAGYTLFLRDNPLWRTLRVSDNFGKQYVIQENTINDISVNTQEFDFFIEKRYTPPSPGTANISVCLDITKGFPINSHTFYLSSAFNNYSSTVQSNGCTTFFHIIPGQYTLQFGVQEPKISDVYFNNNKVQYQGGVGYNADRLFTIEENQGYEFYLQLQDSEIEQSDSVNQKDVCYPQGRLLGANPQGIDYSASQYDKDCRPIAKENTIGYILQQLEKGYTYFHEQCSQRDTSSFHEQYSQQRLQDVLIYCDVQAIAFFRTQSFDENLIIPDETKEEILAYFYGLQGIYGSIDSDILTQTQTTEEFLRELISIFGLQGDYYFIHGGYENRTFLSSLTAGLQGLFPYEQIDVLQATIQQLEKTNPDVLFSRGIHKESLLHVLYLTQDRYHLGVLRGSEKSQDFRKLIVPITR